MQIDCRTEYYYMLLISFLLWNEHFVNHSIDIATRSLRLSLPLFISTFTCPIHEFNVIIYWMRHNSKHISLQCTWIKLTNYQCKNAHSCHSFSQSFIHLLDSFIPFVHHFSFWMSYAQKFDLTYISFISIFFIWFIENIANRNTKHGNANNCNVKKKTE